MTSEKKHGLKGWIFVSPFVFGIIIYYVVVFIQSIEFTFNQLVMTGDGLKKVFIGLQNYNYALRVNPDFLKTLTSSIVTILVEIPEILIFSLFIAILLNGKLKGRGFFRMVFFIPVILAVGIVEKSEINNLLMTSMNAAGNLGNNSVVGTGGGFDFNKIMISFNLGPQITQFILGVADNIYEVVKKSGVQILIFLGGLQAISPSIYEGAKIEGATGWEAFWKITIPMISPMIFVNGIYTIIDSFTRPSNQMMILIDDVGFGKMVNYGGASAMSWIYTIVILVFLSIIAFISTKFVFYQTKD